MNSVEKTMNWNLRPYQAELLHIFRSFEKVCVKHGFRCYSSGGTSIGAHRPKGFIPWDDDMDVEMPRADFVKFLKVAKDELPSYLKICRGGVGCLYVDKTHFVWELVKDKGCYEKYLVFPQDIQLNALAFGTTKRTLAGWRVERVR